MTNSQGQNIQPTIVQINLYIHEISLQKNLKFKGVNKYNFKDKLHFEINYNFSNK